MKYVSVVALAGIALLAIGCGKSEPDLDDSKVLDKLLEDALEESKLQKRGPVGEQLAYAPNEQQPYTGWVKSMHPNGQVEGLVFIKDGKLHGLWTAWHENGQKKGEGTWKDGEKDGLETHWDENGNVTRKGAWKDGELVK
jgi:antitoxin component YwqK of YwqJK toxin-antitoxin module